MTLSGLVNFWRTDKSFQENVVEWRIVPERKAKFVPFPQVIHPVLIDALGISGIRELYSHQVKAFQAVDAGKHIVVTTGTASGKSLCYNLPVLDALIKDPEKRAIYLFPTKALTQDQTSALQRIFDNIKESIPEKIQTNNSNLFIPTCGVFDGDTSFDIRRFLKTNASIILTNPDMLHTGILPHHTTWAKFFQQLQYVVIDEIHTYRGVFGSHVANVIRRLKRISHHYGCSPIFILTSATIQNPGELAEKLIGEQVTPILEDGSARGSQHFLIYNPPITNKDLGLRRSAVQESVRLGEDLLSYNAQTIIFCKSRKIVEHLLSTFQQRDPRSDNQHAKKRIRGYRSGYLPKQRREIERGLRQGNVRAVIATNALELGLDIGEMEAALLVGFPGTIAATLQQAGRAGRGNLESIAVLLTSASPLDQYLAQHPEYFFEKSPEKALINPDNLLILLNHIRCATFELPFQKGDSFGSLTDNQLEEFLEILVKQMYIHKSGRSYFWMADNYPARDVSLRTTSPERVLLKVKMDEKYSTIGEVDFESAHWMVHPRAIYFHESQTFFIEDLNFEEKTAVLCPISTDYYTEPRNETTISVIEVNEENEIPVTSEHFIQIGYGEVSISTQVIGFRKIAWDSHETLGTEELSLPAVELKTTAFWLALSNQLINKLRESGKWRNDPNAYGPNWKSQRDKARARDQYRCQVCNTLEKERAHDVHHKTPFRQFTTFSQANHLGNLVTLCVACHHKVETVVRVRSGMAGLGYILGNLSPLFLMCDPRDIGVHFEPQFPGTDGLPTIIIFDKIPGGIGLSKQIYESNHSLLKAASELVTNCPCLDGCPSCVGPGGENGIGEKNETLAILEIISNCQ